MRSIAFESRRAGGLAEAYRRGDPALAPFFRVFPADGARIGAPPAGLSAPRGDVARAVAAYLEAGGAPAEARRAAADLADPRCATVLTGQQAGFLGGPLYVAWKAATAIRIAREIEARDGRKAVAIFWVASDDHDAAEIRSVAWLGRRGGLREASLAIEEGRRAIESVRMDAELRCAAGQTVDAIARDCGDGLREAAEAYLSAPDLGAAASRLIGRAFGRHGLVVIEPRAVRGLGGPIFEREIDGPGETSRLVAAAGEALRARGFRAQLGGSRDVHLFALREGERIDVARGDRPGDATSLSAAVALRPVLQDYLFGTWALVAGPAEVAYLAQLRGVYERFGVTMPAVVPRFAASILPPRLARVLARRGIDAGTALARPASLAPPIPAAAEIDALGDAAERVFDALARAIPDRDPLARKMAHSQARIGREIDRLRHRLRARGIREDEELRSLLDRVREALEPGGEAQERRISWISCVARHGISWVERAIAAADPFAPGPSLLVPGDAPASARE
ncbi:MAG: bacillithiol biosynthesis BshC [Planctomycetes bacterium]|nr:bacillithiol biosynthesis BshC [Planctomycetota bacterium]